MRLRISGRQASRVSAIKSTWSPMLTIVRAVALTAAGQPAQARACLGAALQSADDTRVHFYDAELLRPRANTHNEPQERRADVGAALEVARRQGATLFQLRAALGLLWFQDS